MGEKCNWQHTLAVWRVSQDTSFSAGCLSSANMLTCIYTLYTCDIYSSYFGLVSETERIKEREQKAVRERRRDLFLLIYWSWFEIYWCFVRGSPIPKSDEGFAVSIVVGLHQSFLWFRPAHAQFIIRMYLYYCRLICWSMGVIQLGESVHSGAWGYTIDLLWLPLPNIEQMCVIHMPLLGKKACNHICISMEVLKINWIFVSN